MGQKRTKKKRRWGGSGKSGKGGSTGTLGGLRGGMKRVVGQGPPRKESSLSKILTWVLLAAAVALLAYRLYGR